MLSSLGITADLKNLDQNFTWLELKNRSERELRFLHITRGKCHCLLYLAHAFRVCEILSAVSDSNDCLEAEVHDTKYSQGFGVGLLCEWRANDRLCADYPNERKGKRCVGLIASSHSNSEHSYD